MTFFFETGNNSYKGPAFAGLLGNLLLNNQPIPNVGDATGLRGSATAGNLYLALHTAEPYTGDAQNSNEAAYSGYARVPVPRGSSEWSLLSQQSNYSNSFLNFFATYTRKSLTYFPRVAAYSGGGSADALITHVSLGTDLAGAGMLMYVCELENALQLEVGKVPSIPNLQFCEG